VPTGITIHNTGNETAGANAAAHAKYQKGADARKRRVSWHFTVDDKSVYQSLPTNEIGWHAGKGNAGNATTIGVEICMNVDLDVPAAYRRAALLTAVLAFQHKIKVPRQIFQHFDWSGKECPRTLRAQPNGWKAFLDQTRKFLSDLENVPTAAISLSKADDHHHID
jgi:N-acetylmuramoyl-L-alanine amidase CwlA